jgi:pimeloyl-ACP methyl ester carboxylesterase
MVAAYVGCNHYQNRPEMSPASGTVWRSDEEAWENMLSIYDIKARNAYGDCDARILSSRFGNTQVYACGNPQNSSVFLLHDAVTSSLSWEWLIPELVQQSYYTVAVDILCDMGRSIPKDGKVEYCPKGPNEIAEWVIDIKEQLGISHLTRISLVGHSYGGFLTTQIALSRPEVVARMVLINPAATFAPLATEWKMRLIATIGVLPYFGFEQKHLTDWFYRYIHANSGNMTFEEMVQYPHAHWDLRLATDKAGRTHILEWPSFLGVPTLTKLNHQTPILLLIGDQDVVTEPQKAIKNAKDAGVPYTMYEGLGHLLGIDFAMNAVMVKEVVQFLSSPVVD